MRSPVQADFVVRSPEVRASEGVFCFLHFLNASQKITNTGSVVSSLKLNFRAVNSSDCVAELSDGFSRASSSVITGFSVLGESTEVFLHF